jgi:hypothetical protein
MKMARRETAPLGVPPAKGLCLSKTVSTSQVAPPPEQGVLSAQDSADSLPSGKSAGFDVCVKPIRRIG